MNRLAIAVVPFLAFCGVALADAPAPDPAALRITHALNLLEAEGYSDFRNFHAAGNDFAATITSQGRTFTVMIDPDSNQVTPQG